MDIRRYLERIHYQGSLEPTRATLEALHEAHMYTVPFENLDIMQYPQADRKKAVLETSPLPATQQNVAYQGKPKRSSDFALGRTIRLNEDSLHEKIIEQHRGGFCYELNGLFALLLRTLGFQVELLSAGVARAAGGFGPEFDHLTLLVHLEEDWLADVGFGDSFRQPLRLQAGLVQEQEWGRYRLERDGEHWLLQEWNEEWKASYRFTLQPHILSDFSAMCHYHQTSPESGFTKHRTCSLATSYGRITLSDFRLITTRYGIREEREVTGQEEYDALLSEQFGIMLQ